MDKAIYRVRILDNGIFVDVDDRREDEQGIDGVDMYTSYFPLTSEAGKRLFGTYAALRAHNWINVDGYVNPAMNDTISAYFQ